MMNYCGRTRRDFACILPRAIGDSRGISAVEFALVAPIVVLFMVGVLDGGLAIKTGMDVSNAARAGAEYAAIHGWNDSGITSAAANATSTSVTTTNAQFCGCPSASGVSTQACATTCAASGKTVGTYVSTTTKASYTPVFPAFWSSFLTNGSWQYTVKYVTRIS
jgi:Flp pilus assembly protein TadG